MQRYRAMLLARSPEERLKMGCSMGATTRSLLRASVLAQDPHASPAAVRRALFLRFYGHEFEAAERERILERLGQDEPRPAGPAKRVPVNWDDLEMALTSNPGEWTCYLDLKTGVVRMVPMDRLNDDDDGLSEDEIDAGLDAGRLIYVEPLGSRVEYGWMEEFTGTVGDARLRDRLEVALDGGGAFRRFKNVLLDFPAERERHGNGRRRVAGSGSSSVAAEAGNRDQEVERAAELVEPTGVPAHERLALLVSEVGVGESRPGVGAETVAEGRILLQAIQNDVRLVAAHATSHSRAARSIRPISPKKRVRARAGFTAPRSTSQLSSSCDPLSCRSLAVSAVMGSKFPAS